MESKHLIIAGIWSVIIIIIIGFFITGIGLEFFGYLLLLFIAFVFSLITEFLLVGKTSQRTIPFEDLLEMKSEIKRISEDIEELKKH